MPFGVSGAQQVDEVQHQRGPQDVVAAQGSVLVAGHHTHAAQGSHVVREVWLREPGNQGVQILDAVAVLAEKTQEPQPNGVGDDSEE
jgi:hypothetical protein